MGIRSRSRAAPWRALPALLVSLWLLPVGARAAQSGDAFVCYKSRHSGGQPKFEGSTAVVTDDRDTRTLDVKAPRLLCVPADLGDGVLDPATALLGYKAKLVKGSPPYDPGVGIQVLNNLGELYVDTGAKPSMLLVPTAVDSSNDPLPPDPNIEHP